MPLKLKVSTPRHGLLESFSFVTDRGQPASEGEGEAQGFTVPPEAAQCVLDALRLAVRNSIEQRNPPGVVQRSMRGIW